jgi:hypothetical protein
VNRTLSLPPDNLKTTRELLNSWVSKKKASKKELQQLVGKLNWCARVVFGGRSFMRNLTNLIMKLRKPHHRVRITSLARSDITWWVTGLDLFHGTTSFQCDTPLPSYHFATDACLSGGGGHFGKEWFYVNWVCDIPELGEAHINVLELETVLIAAELWGAGWRNCHILVRSDNTATVSAINKGSSRSPQMLLIMQKIFWLSVEHGFRLTASFIPGKINILSDLISRLSESESAIKLQEFLKYGNDLSEIECYGRMTEKAFLFLQAAW